MCAALTIGGALVYHDIRVRRVFSHDVPCLIHPHEVTNALCQLNPSYARQLLHRTRLLLYGSLLFGPYNTCTAVGHKKPMRRNARLTIPNAPLNQTRTVTPVMMGAEARTMAICTAADASS